MDRMPLSFDISPTQVNVLAPPDLAAGPVPVQVETGGAVSAVFAVQAQQQSPSFFVFGGTSYVVGTHANWTDFGPTTLYPGLTTPAAPGEVVILFGNGFGVVTPPVTAGSETQLGTLPTLPVIQIAGIQRPCNSPVWSRRDSISSTWSSQHQPQPATTTSLRNITA
jgi:uncharacterized protein (TIGR03437 family)